MGLFQKIFGKNGALEGDFEQGSKTDFDSFSQLLFYLQKQKALDKIVQGLNWSVDANSALIYFGNELAFPIQAFGHFTFEDSAWKWAWSEPQSRQSIASLREANKLHKIGTQKGIPELSTPHFRTDKTFLQQIGLVAAAYAPYAAPFALNYGKGAMLVTVETARLATETRPAKVLCQLINEFTHQYKSNHQEAVFNYFVDLGLALRRSDTAIEARYQNGLIRARFNDKGSLKGIDCR